MNIHERASIAANLASDDPRGNRPKVGLPRHLLQDPGLQERRDTVEPVSWLRVPDEGAVPPEVEALFEPPREKLGFVPNVLRNFALRPPHLLGCDEHYQQL